MLSHKMMFKGRVLTGAQVEVLVAQPAAIINLSARHFRKAIDKALNEAGLPVPDIEVGQVVSWTVNLKQDKGRVVSYDERKDKYRVTSKMLKRDVTVCGRDIQVLVKEAEDATAE